MDQVSILIGNDILGWKNAPNYNPDQGYQQYYQDPSHGMPMQRQAVNQYLNQVNYANAYNHVSYMLLLRKD